MADQDSTLGAKLRGLRESRDLSQRELARRAGVSNATVSMVEKGQTDPTVGLLMRLLSELGTTVSAFFDSVDAPAPTPGGFFFGTHQMVDVGAGSVKFLQPGRSTDGRKLQILHETYPPGASTGPETLAHPGEEGGFVLSGRLEVTVGAEIRTLSAGEAYYFPSHLPHRFRNPDDEPCVLVSACTPPF